MSLVYPASCIFRVLCVYMHCVFPVLWFPLSVSASSSLRTSCSSSPTLMTILTPDAAPSLTLVPAWFLHCWFAGCSALFYLAELLWAELINCFDSLELDRHDLSLDWDLDDWFNLILTWLDLIWLIVPSANPLCRARLFVFPRLFRQRDHFWRRRPSFRSSL